MKTNILTVLDIIKQDLHINLIQGTLNSKKVEEIFTNIKEEIKDREIFS